MILPPEIYCITFESEEERMNHRILEEVYGITCLESIRIVVESLLRPEEEFSWKNVEFFSSKDFTITDGITTRWYSLNPETMQYHLNSVLYNNAAERATIEEMPTKFPKLYKKLKRNGCLASIPRRQPIGGIVFETQTDLESFYNQHTFKNSKDLEKLINTFLKPTEPETYLVRVKNGRIIALSDEQEKIKIDVLNAREIVVYLGILVERYRIMDDVTGRMKIANTVHY